MTTRTLVGRVGLSAIVLGVLVPTAISQEDLRDASAADDPAWRHGSGLRFIYDIREMPFNTRHYIAYRDTVAFSDIGDFFLQHLHPIHESLGSSGSEMAGPPTGLFWVWDEETETTIMAAGIPVTGPSTEVGGYQSITVRAGKAVVTDHYGSYDASAAAHEAIDGYLNDRGLGLPDIVLEEYLTDPALEPDSSKWHTRILYVFEDEHGAHR